MRLIDTDKLIDDLIHFAPEHYTALINMLIEKQPQVDAVEVVWCNDCKYWDTADIHSCAFIDRFINDIRKANNENRTD